MRRCGTLIQFELILEISVCLNVLDHVVNVAGPSEPIVLRGHDDTSLIVADDRVETPLRPIDRHTNAVYLPKCFPICRSGCDLMI